MGRSVWTMDGMAEMDGMDRIDRPSWLLPRFSCSGSPAPAGVQRLGFVAQDRFEHAHALLHALDVVEELRERTLFVGAAGGVAPGGARERADYDHHDQDGNSQRYEEKQLKEEW